ncbi:MAG TPA: hypothetical protein DCG06_15975, partial [Deltaproteobacteria bacterium]|nr:hypothetical protein [Deltaproteobacteria bacterium]
MADSPEIDATYSLTPLQQGLLFHSLWEPGARSYFTQIRLEIAGALDVAAFRRAWENLLRHHPTLRTAFVWEDLPEPFQVVRSAGAVKLPFVELDWRSMDPANETEALDQFFCADYEKGFDLARAPLMRMTLLRLEEERFCLVWSHHHLILDGWSLPLLLEDVLVGYERLRAGEPAQLVDRRPFRDHIARLQAGDSGEAEKHWRTLLAGYVIPTEKPRTPNQGYRELRTSLSAEVSHRLVAWARSRRLTLNTLVQAAWFLARSRRTGVQDLVFGVTTSGRSADLAGAESMVGLFINTLPLRVEMDASRPLEDWLRDIQGQTLDLRRFEHTGLAQVQSWAEISSGTPLFDSVVVFESYPLDPALLNGDGPLKLGILEMDPEQPSAGLAAERNNYPLTLVVFPGDEILLMLAQDRARVSDAEADALLEEVVNILTSFEAESALELGEMQQMPHEEHQRLLDWGRGKENLAEPSMSVPLQFSSIAREFAEKSAVLEPDGRRISYGSLENLARATTRELRLAGIGPGDVVALEIERGALFLASLLGVWGAGASYVALDPTQPLVRRRWMLSDSGSRCAISNLGERSATGGQIPVLRPAVPGPLGEVPLHKPSSGETAYILYTSGSTGKPKGVRVSHGALTNYLSSIVDLIDLRPGMNHAWLTTPGADLGHTSVFGSLVTGGSLSVLEESRSVDGKALGALAPDVLKVAPSHLRALLGTGDPKEVLPRDRLVLGGESLPPGLLEEVHACRPDLQVFNHYGPTETTVGVVAQACSFAPQERLPIGRPLAHAAAYVVDPSGGLVAEGVAGELWVGGPSLAEGYQGRAAETASRFVPDRWSKVPGARVYRTGDRALWRDGDLYFLGRTDGQISLHGNRIESEEVERAIEREVGVIEAAVAVHANQLVAYVVLEGGYEGTSDNIRRALVSHLPTALIPSRWEELDELPVTANGKLDRASLAAPGSVRKRDEMTTMPVGALEELLASIWSEVLALDAVGREENFFTLGGDSIQSLQVVTKARRAGWRVTPKAVFENPTVRELAAVCEPWRGEQEFGPVEGQGPLTPIQEWFFDAEPEDAHHWNQGFLFDIEAGLSEEALGSAVQRLVMQHDALRLRLARSADGIVQRYCPQETGSSCVQVVDTDGRPSSIEAAAEEAQRSLDFEEGPVFRVVLLRCGARDRILLTAHHLVVDGVSWRVLLEDLQSFLASPLDESPVGKTTSYLSWAHHLHALAHSDAFTGELSFWDRPMETILRRDHEAENRVGEIDSVEESLTASETASLLGDVAPVYRAQLDEILLTAVAQTLAAWLECDRIDIELEGHGRDSGDEEFDLSRTVGWFTTRFPVSLTGAGNLIEVKEELRAVPNQGRGWGVLRYLSEHSGTLARRSCPPISYNNLGVLDGTLQDGQLRMAVESAGELRGPRGKRRQEIDIVVHRSGGQLHLQWLYAGERFRKSTMVALARQSLDAIRELIAGAQREDVGCVSASDFPLAGLSTTELQGLLPEPIGIEDVYPLTPMQEGMLFHSRTAADSSMYVNQLSGTLGRDLDSEALRRSWEALVERHGILRTRFCWDRLSRPLQVVERRGKQSLEILDWSGLPLVEAERLWAERVDAERAQGFDLRELPLQRLVVVQWRDGVHRFCWSRHHILLDGWCS